jgi:hypothetical protein
LLSSISLFKKSIQFDQAINGISTIFKITQKDTVDDFLGVKKTRDEQNKTVSLTQPQLISSILQDLKLGKHSNPRPLPAQVDFILHRFTNEPAYTKTWHYCSTVGKLNYSTRPDLAYAVHQCARFSETPKESHSKAIKHIGRYLLGTRNNGLIYQPKHESLVCYCDADFFGNWNQSIAANDASTAQSRTGYIIFYAGFPVVWTSRPQSKIAFSSTQRDYISF